MNEIGQQLRKIERGYIKHIEPIEIKFGKTPQRITDHRRSFHSPGAQDLTGMVIGIKTLRNM